MHFFNTHIWIRLTNPTLKEQKETGTLHLLSLQGKDYYWKRLIVQTDTYWNNSSWAGMDFIHPVVTICYITYAIVTDRGGPEGVTPFTVDLWADPTAKCEGSKGVVVCKENNCMDQLCQGPAVLFSLQKLL